MSFNEANVKDFLWSEYVVGGFQFALVHFQIAKDSSEYHEVYCISMNSRTNVPFIHVIIIHIKDGEIYWKDMTENEGPCYYNCPTKLFDFVKNKNEYAVEWRAECSKKNVELNKVYL